MRPAAAAAALSLLLCARVATAAPSLLPGDPGHHGEHGAHGEHHGEHGDHGAHAPEHHGAHAEHADHGAAAVDRAGSAGRSISPGVLDFGSGIQVTPRKPGQVGHHNPFLPGYQPSFERSQPTGGPQVSPQVAQQQQLQQQQRLQQRQQQQQQQQQVFSPQPQRPFIPIRPEDLNQNPGTGRSGPKGPVTAGCGAGLVCVPEADCDPYTGFVRGALNRPPADPSQPTVAVQRCELGASTGVCCQERPRPYVDPSVNTIDSQGSLRPDIRRTSPPSAVPVKPAPTFASKPRRPASGARPNFAGNPFLSGLTPAAVPVSPVAPQRPAPVPQRPAPVPVPQRPAPAPAPVPQRPAPVPQQQTATGAQTDRQVTCQIDQRCVEVNLCGADGYIANRAALGNSSPTLTTYCITPFNGRGVCCRPRPQEPPASASQPTQQQQRPAAQAQPQPQPLPQPQPQPQPLPQPQPQRPAAQANFQQQPQPQQPQPQQPRPQPQPPQTQTQPPQPQRQPEAETGALSLPTQVSTPESSFEQSFLHLQKAAFQAALQPVPEQKPQPQRPPPPPQPQRPQPQQQTQSRTQATAVQTVDPNSTPESSFEQSLLQIQKAAFQQRKPEGPQQAVPAASATPAVCGRSGAIPVPGVTPAAGEAQFGELPWHAVIYYTNGTFVCGGTLIGERHVLTAAHCLSYIRPAEIQVRLGEYQLYSDREPLPHQDITVSVIHMNPGFREGPLFEDVAVLELASPVQLADNVQPICLPEAGQSFEGRRCIASGWGKQEFDAGAPSVLKKVELPIVRNEMCQSSLKTTSLGSFFQLHRSFICAGGETGVNACQGDGGGPLACLVDGSYVLAGVTSWSIECGHQDAPPAVFASVTEVLDFILESTGAAPAASGSETSIRRANRPDRNASYGR